MTTDKHAQPFTTPWPEYKHTDEPVLSTIGRFALYALIRAHGIPWNRVDEVYFELAPAATPDNAADLDRIIVAATRRAWERRGHNA
jgi:hypothetical protein